MKVLSLISGKGGSGKTSVAISLAQMLAILNRRVLLIDLDTATHGASYFFESKSPGLEEWVLSNLPHRVHSTKNNLEPLALKDTIRRVPLDPPFDFIPSKTQFEVSDWDADHVSQDVEKLASALQHLIKQDEYDYTIFDCQAGVNVITAAALRLSTHTIIVTEADSVSTKALKSLQNQFSHLLPSYTRVIINKLFLQERSTYDQLTSILRNLEFLPPIPFDMDVRDAFAQNIVPLQQERPTAYFSAVLRVLRELFPELLRDIEHMSASVRRIEFGDYEAELTKLTKQKEELEELKKMYIGEMEMQTERIERIRRMTIPFLVLVVSFIPLLLRMFARTTLFEDPTYLLAILGGLFAYAWLAYEIVFRRKQKAILAHERKLQNISKELEGLDERIDKYNTLYLTERKKLLI